MATLKPILLVEDNPKDLELTLEAFAEAQLANDIVVARDGAEALSYLFHDDGQAVSKPTDPKYPAVIILDIKLPKVDGIEVLQRIKANENTRAIPVVMLTSSKEEQDLVRSYRLGVNAFVVKPVGFKEFFDAIRDIGSFWAILNEPPPGCLPRRPRGT
ncbi:MULTISPECIES: response regulator [unclassified Azospirillum]|uniref:response regulator n=1 Tax=unclassified Azospirillum TaxID=2630922 RepID=UPI000D61BAE3|nr:MULTISPECIES: response regulator [unclassified Azospirillum]PWC47015.1 chemotaxis protein CheY [Azospirillum sp. TSA6c]PWC78035.1 chemotaxis protein CheY [Azospirillum sp. TSH64]